jgi:hypothetical protein
MREKYGPVTSAADAGIHNHRSLVSFDPISQEVLM